MARQVGQKGLRLGLEESNEGKYLAVLLALRMIVFSVMSVCCTLKLLNVFVLCILSLSSNTNE